MRRILLGASAILVLLGAMGACTGEDPVSTPAPSGTSGGPADAAAEVPTRGIFLTSTRYETNFAADVAPAELNAFVDGICAKHASDAGLGRADAYRAAIATSQDETAELQRMITLGGDGVGQWCRIGNAEPHRPRCNPLGLVFASTDSITTGPINELLTDEKGDAVADSKFFSGIYVPAADEKHLDRAVRNCFGWKNQVLDYDSGALPPEYGFAFGEATAEASTEPFKWLGHTYAFCESRFVLPLLCIEAP